MFLKQSINKCDWRRKPILKNPNLESSETEI